MSPSQTQRCILTRQFLCVIVSFDEAFGLSKWHKICMFYGSSGRKLRTWKCPVWLYNMSSFLLMCPFCQKSSDSEYGSHSYYNLNWAMVKPGDGGISHPFDVWWLKKKMMNQLESWFPNVCKELLYRCVKLKVRLWKLGWNHFYPNSDVPLSSLLKPPLSIHCKNRPVLKDQCVVWYIITRVNHICTSFFSRQLCCLCIYVKK